MVISIVVICLAFINMIFPHYTELGRYGSRFLFGIFLLYFGISALSRWGKVNWSLIKPNVLLTIKHSSLFHVGAFTAGIVIMCFKLLDQLVPTWFCGLVLIAFFIFWNRKLRHFFNYSYGQPLALKIACALWYIS